MAGDEVVVAAAVERQLDGKHAFRHVRRQHAVALSNIVKTWSNVVSKRGQQSSKHMVNNRQKSLDRLYCTVDVDIDTNAQISTDEV